MSRDPPFLRWGLGISPRRKRITFEYVMLDGINDTPRDADELIALLHGVPADLGSLYDNMSRHLVIEFAEPQAFTINGDICEPVSVLELEPGPRVSFISG